MTGLKGRWQSTDGSLLHSMLTFALPIMAMNLLQLLFNAADMVVVGRFDGSAALAAVGATGSLINLIVNLFMGLSVGTSVVVARDYGARKVEAIRQSVHTSIAVLSGRSHRHNDWAPVLCSLALDGYAGGHPVGSDSVYEDSFAGMPASMVYNFGAAILRAVVTVRGLCTSWL